MKRTSYPRAVSRAFKVATITAALIGVVVYLSAREGQRTQATQLLDRLPIDTRAVLRIEIDALRTSPSARALVETVSEPRTLSTIEQLCQLDPWNELSEIVVWFQGDRGFRSTGLVLRGSTADAERLAKCHDTLVRARGGAVARVDTAYGPILKSRDDDSALAKVDARTVVTGSEATVRSYLSTRGADTPSLRGRPDMLEPWNEPDPAPIAAIVDLPTSWRAAIDRLGPNDASILGALGGVKTITFRAQDREALKGSFAFDFESTEQAAKSATRLAQLSNTPPPSLPPVFASMIRNATALSVSDRVTWTVPLDAEAMKRVASESPQAQVTPQVPAKNSEAR